MKNEKNLKKLKEIAPLLWNSYQHMYDTRKTNIDNRTNFLLVIISFLAGISIMLFTYFKDYIFFIPFLLQIISFVILLKVFFINFRQVHWFKLEEGELFNNLDKDNFYQDLLADLKALENDTCTYMTNTEKIIKTSLYILLFSLCSLFLALIFVHFGGRISYFLILVLILLIMALCIYYKKQPKFEYENSLKIYRKQIGDWINNNVSE